MNMRRNDSFWEYTKIAEIMQAELESEFDFYYTRERVEAQFNTFLRTKKKDSNYMFEKIELNMMLEKCNITDYDLNKPEELLERIKKLPSEKDIYNQLFLKMYEISKQFKEPQDYMERLVRRLGDEEFQDDSVRLAILKQFIKHTDYCTQPIIDYVVSNSGKKVSDAEKISFVLDNTDESIFDLLEADSGASDGLSEADILAIECKVLLSKFEGELKFVKCETADALKKYADGDDAAEICKAFLSGADCDVKTKRELVDMIKDDIIMSPALLCYGDEVLSIPAESCSKQMFELISGDEYIGKIKVKDGKKIKNCLGMYEGYSADIPLTDKISIIIRKFDDIMESSEDIITGYFNDIASGLLHSVHRERLKTFNHYNNQRKKDAKKSIKKPLAVPELLKMANDLANGNFYTNGKTKNALYMFAFAFDMNYCHTADGDDSYDINKNLFYDYYNHNLLNYLQRDVRYEAEPTGAGINLKNFREVIYLYYLSRKDLPVRERLQRALKTAETCAKKFRERLQNDKDNIVEAGQMTQMYINDYSRIITLPEEALPDYICNNYFYSSENVSMHDINIASEENTAYENCMYIVRLIKNLLPGTDEDSLIDTGIEDIESALSDAGINDEKFRKVLENMNRILNDKLAIVKTGVADKKKIKRTDIIALSYYYKIIESQDAEYEDSKNLSELREDFCDFTDQYLEDSRYQTISFKNIFDVFVILSLYRLSGETPYEIVW